MFKNVPEIMTFNECKDLLKVGKNTLLDLLHSGELEGFKIGRRWRVTRDSVIEYLKYL